jgi:spore maturation protein CgeB
MKMVILGLSVSSSWGNGHATLWRGLCAALARNGHKIVFFERDVPYYASHRDVWELPGGELILYSNWADVLPSLERHLADADVGIVTSYQPDAIAASRMLLDSRTPLRVFYDLDSPITLDRLASGLPVDYVGPHGYRDFDLVLSYAGGAALNALKQVLGARRVAPLYGSVDPSLHRPASADERFIADLSYLGTHSADRDHTLQTLFVQPALQMPSRRFVLGGAQYDDAFPWQPNIFSFPHISCADHPAFYCSAKLTLNVTRGAMARMGYCPSGRLFEATACGAAVLTDEWEGLDQFFEPGSEVIVAHGKEDVIAALKRSPEELAAIGRAGRERTISCHTADIRARELEDILSAAFHSRDAFLSSAAAVEVQ